MKKDKKIWLCFTHIFIYDTILLCFLCFAPAAFLYAAATTIEYIFSGVLFGVIFSIRLFLVLWDIQFVIFKEDYFVFGNIFKKELYRFNYDNLFVIKRMVLTDNIRFYKRSKELKEFKKTAFYHKHSGITTDEVFFVFDDIKKFNLDLGKYQVLASPMNVHFKKRLIMYYTPELEELLVEIQHSRGKYLDGSSMKNRNKPYWGDK